MQHGFIVFFLLSILSVIFLFQLPNLIFSHPLPSSVDTVTSVRIAIEVNGEISANSHVRAKVDDIVKLKLFLTVKFDGGSFETDEWRPEWGTIDIIWSKILPERYSYDNTEGGIHIDPIQYRVLPVVGWEGKFDVTPDVVDDRYPTPIQGCGTMRFLAEISFRGERTASPGPTSVEYGLTNEAPEKDKVCTLSIRRDDSYIGMLSEGFNVPFVMMPLGRQSDSLVGFDCASYAIYGMRRLGREVPYVHPYAVTKWCDMLYNHDPYGSIDEKGVFLDKDGKRVCYPSGNCLIHFWFEVSILYEDRGVPGFLDLDDLVLFTWLGPPEVESIRNSGFLEYGFGLLRWK